MKRYLVVVKVCCSEDTIDKAVAEAGEKAMENNQVAYVCEVVKTILPAFKIEEPSGGES